MATLVLPRVADTGPVSPGRATGRKRKDADGRAAHRLARGGAEEGEWPGKTTRSSSAGWPPCLRAGGGHPTRRALTPPDGRRACGTVAPRRLDAPGGHVGSTQTVSVLMTDLVGSTRMAGELGSRWDGVLPAHLGELETVVEHHGGTKVKGVGDGLMAVFRSASDALSCAVA